MPTITNYGNDNEPLITADVLAMDDARAFVILRLGPAISEALLTAAAQIEATRPAPAAARISASADPCTHCGGVGFTTHDVLTGGCDHDTEERECQTCHGTGRAPAEALV